MAFLQFGAAIPLGILTASIVSRLRFHKIRAAGVDIALFGGFASAIFLGVSALSSWVLSQSEVASDAGTVRAIWLLGFATGGVGHTATLGLLLAGAAVTCLFYRLMPPWMPWVGLVIAAIAELSVLSLLFQPLSILLPLSRFPGYIWLIIAGFSILNWRERTTPAARKLASTEAVSVY